MPFACMSSVLQIAGDDFKEAIQGSPHEFDIHLFADLLAAFLRDLRHTPPKQPPCLLREQDVNRTTVRQTDSEKSVDGALLIELGNAVDPPHLLDNPAVLISAAFRYWDITANGSISQHGPDLRLPRVRSISGVWGFLYDTVLASGSFTFFGLSNGYLGIAAGNVAQGHSVVMVRGSKLPLVLRLRGDCWTLQGAAYIHGIMHRELMKLWEDVDVLEDEYVLC